SLRASCVPLPPAEAAFFFAPSAPSCGHPPLFHRHLPFPPFPAVRIPAASACAFHPSSRPISTVRRLDQLIASLGYCSRSEVRDLIADERVTVRGELADGPSQKVSAADVRLDGAPLDHPDGLLLLLHKPLGLVC